MKKSNIKFFVTQDNERTRMTSNKAFNYEFENFMIRENLIDFENNQKITVFPDYDKKNVQINEYSSAEAAEKADLSKTSYSCNVSTTEIKITSDKLELRIREYEENNDKYNNILTDLQRYISSFINTITLLFTIVPLQYTSTFKEIEIIGIKFSPASLKNLLTYITYILILAMLYCIFKVIQKFLSKRKYKRMTRDDLINSIKRK